MGHLKSSVSGNGFVFKVLDLDEGPADQMIVPERSTQELMEFSLDEQAHRFRISKQEVHGSVSKEQHQRC